ncbi:hypothetical protein TGS27_2600 [Geobacillus stearothermophilus]|uniref:Uncharacterized protein n=1 Tax=Geobacillus thermopakistaniensis (strain MAS1) TaxID=1408282 RepID=A0A7U9J8X9_GEOTM|nr:MULTISPECIES: hypothetical protein [Geobacillus]ESU71176.1 hypothetical protein T260_15105 [Geobacillus sp. MAS1]OAO77816.1 hypothetical protein TGS27_2600 [Geobacillus stearothermophilus]
MSEKAEKRAEKELKCLVLVSPSGHKYEVTVSDAGSLIVAYKGTGE